MSCGPVAESIKSWLFTYRLILVPAGPECTFSDGGYFIPLCLSHSLNVSQLRLLHFTMFILPHSFASTVNASYQAIISLLLPHRHQNTFSSNWCMVNQSVILLVTWNFTRYNPSKMQSFQLLQLMHCNLVIFLHPWVLFLQCRLLLYNCQCFKTTLFTLFYNLDHN